jgi:hypothetical protein
MLYKRVYIIKEADSVKSTDYIFGTDIFFI